MGNDLAIVLYEVYFYRLVHAIRALMWGQSVFCGQNGIG